MATIAPENCNHHEDENITDMKEQAKEHIEDIMEQASHNHWKLATEANS